MNVYDILLLAALALALGLAARRVLRARGSACGGCGGSCAACPHACGGRGGKAAR